MLLENIRKDPELSKYLIEECCEEGVAVKVADSIPSEDYLIIKVDAFYNTKDFATPPPAPDCLILQKCVGGGYAFTIVELKSIRKGSGFTVANMQKKFETCLGDFMSRRFKKYFLRDYNNFQLFFVSNIDANDRDMGLRMKTLINKRFEFSGKRKLIQPFVPIPVVKPCY